MSFFFLVSFQFWWTSWDGAPCGCHFIFFSSKQLAIFLLLVFVYLFSPMILVVYNANVLLVVVFFNNVDRHCWGTCFCFLLYLIVLIVIARAWCLLHHRWCSGSFIALAIPFYAFCFVLFLLVFCFSIFFVFVFVNLSMVPCV